MPTCYFSINKITGNVVIVAYFNKIVKYSPHVVVRFQRKDKEPLELEDFLKTTYGIYLYFSFAKCC